MASTITPSDVQKLNTDQIIAVANAETKSPYSPEQAIRAIRVEMASPDAWKVREGNTIFIVHKSQKPGYGLMRVLNADSAYNYVKNAKVFSVAAYKAGFDVVAVDFKDPSIMNIFKFLAKSPPNEGMGYSVSKTEDGGYRATLSLGRKRGV